MNISLGSIMLLRSARHYLLQILEVLTLIPEAEYMEFIKLCRTKKKKLRAITDNAEEGNVFLTMFALLELIDEIVDETPVPDPPG